MTLPDSEPQKSAHAQVEGFRDALGPFVTAVEATRMPMIFTEARENHPIVFANEAIFALTGYTPAALLGKPIGFLLGTVGASAMSSSIAAAMLAGQSGTWEMQCCRADKSAFLAAVFQAPVRDADQNLRHNFLSFVDLTSHAERNLLQAKNFRALYEEAPGLIAVLDGPSFRFTYANAAWQRTIGKKDPAGLTYIEVFPEPEEQGSICMLEKVYSTGLPFVGRAMLKKIIKNTNGVAEDHYLDCVYQPIKDDQQRTTGIFFEGFDVTEQRNTIDRLSDLQSEIIHYSYVNAMGTMATMLGHELNQPLTVIGNYTSALLRVISPKTPDYALLVLGLQGISDASQRAADIIRNLRDHTRRRLGAKEVFFLMPAVADCIRLVSASTSPEITISKHIPAALTVLGDEIQLQQVLINLLINACDAVENSDIKQISVTAQETDDNLIVSIIDSGCGVSAKAAEDLFAWGNSSKPDGMGLGLSICRTIIEAHRGRIWLADSTARGSEFCFSVPRNRTSPV